MKKIILILVILFGLFSCASNENYIYSKREDSLDAIAHRNFKRVKNKYRNEEAYKKDLIKWNADITSWQNMDKNKIIYVEYPYGEYVGSDGIAPDKESIKSH